jgi:membrane protein implicated in regulation of membrane protease activity
MKDVTGKELTVDDKIVLIPQNGYTQSLSMGIIVGFTAQKVRIKLTGKAWEYSADECLKFPEQVAKV